MIIGDPTLLGGVALKALLMYASALLLLRVGERRTLAQLSIFDVIVAVAIGAVVGRTVTARDTSWLQGAVALAVLIASHRILALLRFLSAVRTLTDHKPRLLVLDGQVQRRQLLRSGIPVSDLEVTLRQGGVHDVRDVRLAVFEGVGKITVVRRGETGELVDKIVRTSARGS